MTIMGSKESFDNKIKIDGFITLNDKKKKSDKKINLKDIEFNPLELLGDLRYISENMICNEYEIPYNIEPCLKSISIGDKRRYFQLLEEIRKIVLQDRKISLLEVYELANYVGKTLCFRLALRNGQSQDDLKLYDKIGIPFLAYTREQIESKEFVYYAFCDDLMDIILSVLAYLVIFNYHFFKCEHCKRYSAELRHQKNRRYCQRSNLLNIAIYEGKSCTDAIPSVLNSISADYKRKVKVIYNKIDATIKPEIVEERIEVYEKLKHEYRKRREKIKADPSADNISELKEYLKNI